MTAMTLITTTINIPHVLADYAHDAKEHGRTVKFYVAGDRKTPPEAAAFCTKLTTDTGVECEYMSPQAQDNFMRSYPRLNAHLPWDCVQRRNVALLKAVADGGEIIVTIDDDNFPVGKDYFGCHLTTGKELAADTFGVAGEWFNICRFLAEESNRRFFPRGYGIAARRRPDGELPLPVQTTKRVAVNAGLWLGDPDIDATTRLAVAVNATEYTRQENFFVAAGAWTPFNSQNTALARDVAPAYFLSPFLGRYEDIYISFVVKRIADHLGDGVCFGHPLVRQDRNEHDLLHDLVLEELGTRTTDSFIAALEKVSLHSDSYGACLVELCDQSEAMIREVNGLTMAHRAQFAAFFAGARVWAELPLW